MTADVFGRRMHYQVEAGFDRALQVGSGEGVIRDGEDPARTGEFSHAAQIDELQQWIGRRLYPNHAGIRFHRRFQRTWHGEIGESELKACRALADSLE